MIVFDFAPLTLFFIGCVLCLAYLVFSFGFIILKALFSQFIFNPFYHWKTKKKLYRFERQVYNDTIVEYAWLPTDRAAEIYNARGDFYTFMLKEVYPRDRDLFN